MGSYKSVKLEMAMVVKESTEKEWVEIDRIGFVRRDLQIHFWLRQAVRRADRTAAIVSSLRGCPAPPPSSLDNSPGRYNTAPVT